MILGGINFIKPTGVCYSFPDMFDMRYHIASLVAVFLALTVGLLLGSLIVDAGLLADEQERLLNSIRVDVDKISEKNRGLQSEVTGLRDFQKQVLPIAINDRLNETSVTILTLDEAQDGPANEVEKTLNQAGAATSRIYVNIRDIDVADTDLRQRLRELAEENEISDRALAGRFWPRIAAEISGAKPNELLSKLLDTGLAGADTTGTLIDNLVVVAANDRRIGSRDIVLLDALSEIEGVRVIATEVSEVKRSRIAAYKLRSVSTVDNIDTVPGKISLVYLLSERDVTAHFGTKAAADKLMP